MIIAPFAAKLSRQSFPPKHNKDDDETLAACRSRPAGLSVSISAASPAPDEQLKAVVVESLGLAGSNIHAHDEYIDTVSIVPRLCLVTRLLIKQGKKP